MSSRLRNNSDRHANLSKIDTMYSLKIDNLTFRTRVVDLQRCFEKFGPIGDIYVPRDQFTHSSRGYAFVRFLKKRDAETAIDRMDGTDIDGRDIRVQFARYNRDPGSDGRNKLRLRRSRSRSRSRRRSKHRSRSGSKHRRSRSRSPRRSRSTSRSKRSKRQENGEDDHQEEEENK